MSDVWEITRGTRDKRLKGHSAIFPEELIEKIVLNFTDEGDVVYDPFSGTGTTAVVCNRHNRNFIGSELVEKYCEIIEQRIQEGW